MPLYGDNYKKSYEPYRPPKEDNSSARNLTKLSLGVSLCVAAAITGFCAVNAYQDCRTNASAQSWGWVWIKSKIPAFSTESTEAGDKRKRLLKGYAVTVGLASASILLGATGLNLIRQGLDLHLQRPTRTKK